MNKCPYCGYDDWYESDDGDTITMKEGSHGRNYCAMVGDEYVRIGSKKLLIGCAKCKKVYVF